MGGSWSRHWIYWGTSDLDNARGLDVCARRLLRDILYPLHSSRSSEKRCCVVRGVAGLTRRVRAIYFLYNIFLELRYLWCESPLLTPEGLEPGHDLFLTLLVLHTDLQLELPSVMWIRIPTILAFRIHINDTDPGSKDLAKIMGNSHK